MGKGFELSTFSPPHAVFPYIALITGFFFLAESFHIIFTIAEKPFFVYNVLTKATHQHILLWTSQPHPIPLWAISIYFPD